MNNPTYVPRPTEDPGPPQWSSADLAKARAEGRNDLIVAAMNAGQLRDLLTGGDPAKPHGADHRPGARAMTHEDAERILRNAHTDPKENI